MGRSSSALALARTWVSKTVPLENGNSLNLFGRAAYAHDWQSNATW
jgi:hypothetical protein